MSDPAGAMGVLFASLAIPATIGWLLLRARWRAIVSWPMISTLFFTTPAITLFVCLGRFFGRSKAGVGVTGKHFTLVRAGVSGTSERTQAGVARI